MKPIFIHVAKTGGTSIKKLLRVNGHPRKHMIRHATAQMYLNQLGDAFWEAERFAVVRDPFARYASACRQIGALANRPETMQMIRDNKVKGTHWTAQIGKEIVRRQSESLLIDGKLAVTKLFRFESDLPEAIELWLNEQGYEGQLTHEREVPERRKARRQPLSEEAKDFVREHYRQDFLAFGYDPMI